MLLGPPMVFCTERLQCRKTYKLLSAIVFIHGYYAWRHFKDSTYIYEREVGVSAHYNHLIISL